MGVPTALTGLAARRVMAVLAVLAAVATVLVTTGMIGHQPSGLFRSRPAASTSVPTSPAAETEAAPAPPSEPAPAAESPATSVDDVIPARFAATSMRGAATRDGLADAPFEAVAAYQRAASVINAAAPCNLDWLVLAAIGRIASDHGRGVDGTHRINPRGKVKPALVGQPLNGHAGRAAVSDTDAGAIDQNPRWDAPVGPMGLLPETWSRVAVDADADGERNVQDVDDAALGAAVLLCSSGKDLSHRQALRRALHTYDSTPHFARVVRRLAAAYAEEEVALAEMTALAYVPTDLPAVCACGDAPVKEQFARTAASMPAPVNSPAPAPEPVQPATPPAVTPPAPPVVEPDPEDEPDPEVEPDPAVEPAPEPGTAPASEPEAAPPA